jgi:hypothetical protein
VKVPSVLNVNEKLPPGETVPESQMLVSDVVVCGMLVVALVQVTVVPTVMVIGSGTKRRVWVIETACVVAALAEVAQPWRPIAMTTQATVRAIANIAARAETPMRQPSHDTIQSRGITEEYGRWLQRLDERSRGLPRANVYYGEGLGVT